MALVLLLLSATAVVAVRIPRYREESEELNRRLSVAERATRDSVLQSKARRSQLAVALFQRELRVRQLEQKRIHLAIDTRDSTLKLMHGPMVLRQARVVIGPDSTVRAPDGRTWRFVTALGERKLKEKRTSSSYTVPEWVYISRNEPVPPESERRIEGGENYTLVLDDGTEIYSEPSSGPLEGEAKPGSFMVRGRDLVAIFGAIQEETPVFIY
jgi:hypothetical protein